MNFRKQGWLKKYTELRAGQPLYLAAPAEGSSPEATEKALYRFLQGTGLLYGFPVELPLPEEYYPHQTNNATSDRAHLIFLDCLFGCLQATDTNPKADSNSRFRRYTSLLATYFGVPAPAEGKAPWYLPFRKREPSQELLEQAMKKQLNFSAGLTSFSVYFANSLLFLDIYGCMRLNTLPYGLSQLEEVKAEQQLLRITALKLIAAAAHANGVIAKEEAQVYFQFLRSANISSALAQQLRELLDTGITLADIAIPETSWLVKRYLLEVAILTILADKEVSVEEEQFLDALCTRMGLPPEELEEALTSLQTFLIRHESRLHFFNSLSRFSYAAMRLKERVPRP